MANSVGLQVLTFTDNQLFGGAFLASSDSLVFHNTKYSYVSTTSWNTTVYYSTNEDSLAFFIYNDTFTLLN